METALCSTTDRPPGSSSTIQTKVSGRLDHQVGSLRVTGKLPDHRGLKVNAPPTLWRRPSRYRCGLSHRRPRPWDQSKRTWRSIAQVVESLGYRSITRHRDQARYP